MKEVVEQTGLTDRAVRLYITNGLVNPVCEKSYSGRNSFEFTEHDIVQLKHIALLRKADFSLEQIKLLQVGGNEAKTAFDAYLNEKQSRYEQDRVILQTLNDIASEEVLTVEELCYRLQECFEEQQIPAKDMVMSIRERIGLVGWWSIWGIIVAIYGWMVLSLLVETGGRFPYIHISREYFNVLNVIAGIILVVSGGVLLWSFILRVWFKKSGILAVLISIILIVCCVPPSISVLHVLPFVYSETNNPEDYLQMGDDVRIFMEDIYLVFPAQIPSSGIEQKEYRLTPAIYKETTQYHYWCEYGFAPELDIFAQWEISQELLIRERERILGFEEQYKLQQESKGDWECFIIEFADNPLKTEDCIFRVMFACNYHEGIVRYGAYVSVSNNNDVCRDAYYEKIEW